MIERAALVVAVVIGCCGAISCSSSEAQSGTACAHEAAPDCHAGGVAVCGADWQEAQSLFPACWTPSRFDSFLANCGPYRAVAVFGKDTSTAYFYDASGKLVGHGVRSIGHVTCAAYDASFVFPSEQCKPIEGECSADASVPQTDGGALDGGVLSGSLGGVTVTDVGFVAVGGYQTTPLEPSRPLVLTSADGRSWTVADAPKYGALGDVAFGNGTIVAVGVGGGANSNIFTKPPGSAWQVKPVGTNDDGVLFGNGMFLVTANVEPGAAVSSDGINWTNVTIGGTWYGFVDGRFVAFNTWDLSRAGYRTSTDGLSWSTPAMPSTPLSWVYSLAKVGNQILGFADGPCDGGVCSQGAPYLQLLGPAGTLPSDLTSSPSPLRSLPPRYVPVSMATDGVRVVVTTATAFHTTSLPVGSTGWSSTDVTAQGWTLIDIAYRVGTFAVVGRNGSIPLLATSADGEHWEPVSIAP